MRKASLAALAAAGGAAAAWAACSLTKKMQEKAKREGRHVPFGIYEAMMKRALDMTLGALALACLSPVMGVTALLVRWKLGSPVLFKQERPGRDEKIFQMYKFRTMTDDRGIDGKLLPDEERLTGFGKALRKTSLDELPELVNIIKGDMSIVGPRPLLTEYLNRYDSRQRQRHDVRPGLTGLAQVGGRNCLTWEEKFRQDLNYVEKITFAGDLKIIIRTIAVVFKGIGISSGGSVTMEEFRGGKEQGFSPWQKSPGEDEAFSGQKQGAGGYVGR